MKNILVMIGIGFFLLTSCQKEDTVPVLDQNKEIATNDIFWKSQNTGIVLTNYEDDVLTVNKEMIVKM